MNNKGHMYWSVVFMIIITISTLFSIINYNQSRIKNLNERSCERADNYGVIYYLYYAMTNNKFNSTVGSEFVELSSGVMVKSVLKKESSNETQYLSTFNFIKVNRYLFYDIEFTYEPNNKNINIISYYRYIKEN